MHLLPGDVSPGGVDGGAVRHSSQQERPQVLVGPHRRLDGPQQLARVIAQRSGHVVGARLAPLILELALPRKRVVLRSVPPSRGAVLGQQVVEAVEHLRGGVLTLLLRVQDGHGRVVVDRVGDEEGGGDLLQAGLREETLPGLVGIGCGKSEEGGVG